MEAEARFRRKAGLDIVGGAGKIPDAQKMVKQASLASSPPRTMMMMQSESLVELKEIQKI
jgi:hypothetical protein